MSQSHITQLHNIVKVIESSRTDDIIQHNTSLFVITLNLAQVATQAKNRERVNW